MMIGPSIITSQRAALRSLHQLEHRRHNIVETHTAIDLVGCHTSQQRLDRLEQLQYTSDLVGMFAVGIVCSALQSLDNHISRRTSRMMRSNRGRNCRILLAHPLRNNTSTSSGDKSS